MTNPSKGLWRAFETVAVVLLASLATVQIAILIARALFDAGAIWAQEALLYLNAAFLTLGIAAAALADRHVRISSEQAVTKERSSFGGRPSLIAALVIGLGLAWLSFPYAASSWQVWEGSREIAGLPGVFLAKSLVPLLGLLIALAAALRLFGRT